MKDSCIPAGENGMFTYDNHYPKYLMMLDTRWRWVCSRCGVRLGKHEAVVVNR